MNPFGIFNVITGCLDMLADAVNPKRRKENKKENWKFLAFYWAFLTLCLLAVILVVRSLL